MNKTITTLTLCLSLCAGFAFTKANAAITITGFNVTTNSLSLTFAGTISAPDPVSNANYLYIVNTDVSNGYIFSQQTFITASAASFSGTQSLLEFRAGDQSFGDFVIGHLASDLSVGEAFNGTLTVTWADDIFHPENITDLNNIHVYWGSNGFEMTSGTFLAAVPEPSTVALVSAGAVAALVLAVRRRSNKA